MKSITYALSLALLVSGCAHEIIGTTSFEGETDNESQTLSITQYATAYDVLISPSFPTADQQSIISALDAWSEAVPVHFNVSIADCSSAKDGQICIHNGVALTVEQRPGGNDVRFTGWTTSWQTRADVWLYISGVGESSSWGEPSVFWLTARHEAGHAMGAGHLTGNHVMNSCVNCFITGITVGDVDQWRALREMPPISAVPSFIP